MMWGCALTVAVSNGVVLQIVPAPCDPSKASDIAFDASFSRDGSGRALTSYQWSQLGSNDVVLATAISTANVANGGAGAVRYVPRAARQPHLFLTVDSLLLDVILH